MRRAGFLVTASLAAAATSTAAQSPAQWPQLHGPTRNGDARVSIPRNATLDVASLRVAL